MLAPRSFSQTIDKQAYTAARITASKKNGILRFTAAALALAAVLLVTGMSVMFGSSVRTVILLLKGMFAFIVAITLLAMWLVILPERVKTRAERDFAAYDMLSNGVTVTMSEDSMTVENDCFSRVTAYADTKICVETSDRFVLITDDDAMVVLEKACFADKAATVAFLRDVLARKLSAR